MNKSVVSFFSPVAGIGTTSTVLSIAMSLEKHTDSRIGVLMLNALDEGSDYVEKSIAHLDELKPLLAGEGLNQSEDFLSKFTRIGKQLFILHGNRNRCIERHYHPKEIEYLIDLAEKEFDIVLIDSGSHFDNALSAVSLTHENKIVFVVNQQPKAVRRYHQLAEQILRPLNIDLDNINYLINGYQDKTYILPVKQIAQEMNVKQYSLLPYYDKAILAEIENKILYEVADQKYRDAVDSVAEGLCKDLGLGWTQTEKKKGLAKLFSSRG